MLGRWMRRMWTTLKVIPDAGVINMVDDYPQITAELIVSLNEEGGEANVSTGWHAIEFLAVGSGSECDGAGFASG